MLYYILFALTGYAQIFTLQVTDYGAFAADQTLRSEVDSVISSLVNEVNAEFPNIDQSTYVRGMANSSAIAAKGGADSPLLDFEVFSAGLTGGVGADLGGNSLSDLFNFQANPESFGAIGIAAGLSLGVKGSYLGLDTWLPGSSVFLNFLSIGQTISAIDYKLSHIGARVAFPLYDPEPGIVKWSGVRLSTGLDITSARIVVSQDVSETVPGNAIVVGPETYTFDANFQQTVSIGAEVSTISLPVEVSSGVELLNFIGLFAGLGLDLNTGSAKSVVEGGGPVTFDASGNLGGSTQIAATGRIDAGSNGGPRFENLRLFYGLNFDFFLGNFNIQINQMLLDSIYSGSMGLRFGW